MVIGMDFPGRLMAGFLAILLLFIFPLQYIAQSNTENIDTLIDDRTHELTDSIRRKGHLNKQMYEDYVGYLDTAGERYEIEIRDIKEVKGEEYSYNGIQNDRRGTASFERMSHNHNEIQSFAAHTHTNNCYAEHIHNNNCYAPTGYLNDAIHVTRGDMGGSWGTVNHKTRYIMVDCAACGGRIVRVEYVDRTITSPDVNPEDYLDSMTFFGSYFNAQGQKITLNGEVKTEKNISNFNKLVSDFENMWSFLENKLGPAKIGTWTYNDGIRLDWTGVKVPLMEVYPGCLTNITKPLDKVLKCGYPDDITKHVCNDTDCKYEGIVAGISGGNIYYSKNGTSWTRAFGGSNITDITYGSGKFIAVDGGVILSTDGINWTKHSPNMIDVGGQNKKIYNITYAENGYFYATASYTTASDGREHTTYIIIKSTDGINWSLGGTLSASLDDTYGSNLAVSGTDTSPYTLRLIAQVRGYASGYGNVYGINSFVINSDGSLASRNVSVNVRDKEVRVKQVGNFAFIEEEYPYYMVAAGYKYPVTIDSIPEIIQYGNGTYLAINSSRKALYKSNTIGSFTKATNHNLSFPNTINTNMIYFGDRFMFSGRDSSGYRVYASPDGLNWTSSAVSVAFSKLACNAERGSGEIKGGECLKKGKYYDGNGNEASPVCNQVVTSITATNPNQTVNKGNPIITTATAAYLDGHTAVVNCTSNYNPNAVGSQTVTLTYTGLVRNAKTTGTRTCTINVTVKSLKDLASITVTPASQSIQKYTAPSFTVRANYSDGTNKLLNSSEYSMTGLNARKTGTQNVTISYTEGGITKSATVKVTVTVLQRECPKCRNIYELNPDDTDPGCPFCEELIAGIEVRPDVVEVMQGESLPVTVDAIYNNGSREAVTAWTSNYDSQRKGMQTVTIEYGGYAAIITVWVSDELIKCPVCDTKYPPSESCPVCAEKVVRISVSPKEITVIQYETVVLAVTAFYADGKSSVVDGWAIDTSTASPGRFMATVSYKGASDTIILNVLSINTVECPICGTVYELSENPKGCPICANELTGIEAYLTSGTNLVQLGITPDIAVILIFRDEHREFAEEGYQLENFNPQELGIQTVKVLYKGFSTTVIVEVVNMFDTIICPNGHVYHKNADGTDPGCPFCPMSEETGKVIYFDITYTTEILDIVYSMGEYHFQEGNYISIIITKKDKSLLYRLQKTFFETSLLGRKKRFIYGGEVTKYE